ncbi:MAG TPA: metallophosphoesterase family protein [Thermoanaerobaculia bacterium]
MPILIHCSDVHFGPPHLPHVAEGLLQLIEGQRPDLVVISGDLTQRAKPRQFREARSFVDRIHRLHRSQVPTLVVPGNHDVPMYRIWERVFNPFGAYRSHFSRELEPVYRDREMLVIGINTAFNWTIKGGRITSRRLREIGELLAAAPPGQFRVVVPHHDLIPPPGVSRRRVLANARRAMELFSAAGVDLVLSGHQHQTYIGTSEELYPQGRSPVIVVHSGTTTSSRGRGGERHLNTCNRIEFDARSLVVSHFGWQPGLGRFAEQSRHWYPRRLVAPYTLEGISAPGAPAEVSCLDQPARRTQMGDEKHGQPEWGTARIVESNEEAVVVAGFLKSRGIPAEVESLHVEELPVNVGGLGEVRVRVPVDRLNEALSLLEATDREEPAGDSDEAGEAGEAGDSDEAAEASPGDRAE